MLIILVPASICIPLNLIELYFNTVQANFLAGEKLAKLAKSELFAKIFLTNIHSYTKNVFGICTDCSLRIFEANDFYLYDFPHKNFPVYGTIHE